MIQQRIDITVREDDYGYIETCARIRHISVTRLFERLIKVIAEDQLVLSVLDDNSRIAPQLPGETCTSKYRQRGYTKAADAEAGADAQPPCVMAKATTSAVTARRSAVRR